MGLDIQIATDNYKEVYTIDYYRNEKDFRLKMSLSRDFCNLMSMKHLLNQIAALVEVDIKPIFDMEKYWDDESVEHQLSLGKTEAEKQRIADKIQADNDNVKGNVTKVYDTVTLLIDKLSVLENLEKRVDADDDKTIPTGYYFSDFNEDKGQGYLDNNFGQDLRNFKRFLAYAKSRGTTTVFFNYG